MYNQFRNSIKKSKHYYGITVRLKQYELLCKAIKKLPAVRTDACVIKMNFLTVSFCICALFYRQALSAGPIGTFLQANAIGFPVIHQLQKWVFDPDIALRRRRQFIELHGDKGAKLIERLGLGIDGYGDDRLKMQQERDEGHLGGLNSLRP